MSEAIKAASIFDSSAIYETIKTASTFYSPAMSEAINTASLIYKELTFDNWVKTNIQLFDSVNKRILFTRQIDLQILPVLTKYNWFITVSLENNFINNLSQIIETSSDKLAVTLRNEFMAYFFDNDCKKLKQMVEGWNDNVLFKSRMKIVRDSINLLRYAHNSYNPANLLIPTLISQIDGILTDYLIQNQFEIVKKNGKWVWVDTNMNIIYGRNKVYKKIFDPKVKDYSLTNGYTSMASSGIGSDFIINTLFQTAYIKQKLKNPFGLSRHKIMHGESTTYGRRDHLVRTYLILDFLYGLENVDHN